MRSALLLKPTISIRSQYYHSVIITSKSPDFSKQSTGHENDGEIGREDALGQVSRMFVTINGWRIYCEREERGPTRRVGLSDSDIVVSVEKVE